MVLHSQKEVFLVDDFFFFVFLLFDCICKTIHSFTQQENLISINVPSILFVCVCVCIDMYSLTFFFPIMQHNPIPLEPDLRGSNVYELEIG